MTKEQIKNGFEILSSRKNCVKKLEDNVYEVSPNFFSNLAKGRDADAWTVRVNFNSEKVVITSWLESHHNGDWYGSESHSYTFNGVLQDCCSYLVDMLIEHEELLELEYLRMEEERLKKFRRDEFRRRALKKIGVSPDSMI